MLGKDQTGPGSGKQSAENYSVEVHLHDAQKDARTPGFAEKARSLAEIFDRFAGASLRFITAVGLALFLGWLVSDVSFFKSWLNSLTKGELFGFKFERQVVEEVTKDLTQILTSDEVGIDVASRLSEAAVARAVHSAPAIIGARVLWVDDNPQNNARLIRILRTLRIDVTEARTNDQALAAARDYPFDLVISDVWRAREIGGELQHCQVHYFDFPDQTLRADAAKASAASGTDPLVAFNIKQNSTAPAGFELAERLHNESGQLASKPRLLFYAGRSAGIVRSLCGDGITNRIDVLLQSVVSLLEEQRWRMLNPQEGAP